MQMWQLYIETNGGNVVTGDRDILIAVERVRDLHREAENWRIASGFYRGISEAGGGGSSGRNIAVRWGLASDVGGIEDVLELNGRPRWEASEERFIIAEEAGEVVAVAATRTDTSSLALGRVVADPWGGEEELAVALYRNAVVLARRAGLDRVTAAAGDDEHLKKAGYVREFGGWRADVALERTGVPVGGFRRIVTMFTSGGFTKPRVPGL